MRTDFVIPRGEPVRDGVGGLRALSRGLRGLACAALCRKGEVGGDRGILIPGALPLVPTGVYVGAIRTYDFLCLLECVVRK